MVDVLDSCLASLFLSAVQCFAGPASCEDGHAARCTSHRTASFRARMPRCQRPWGSCTDHPLPSIINHEHVEDNDAAADGLSYDVHTEPSSSTNKGNASEGNRFRVQRLPNSKANFPSSASVWGLQSGNTSDRQRLQAHLHAIVDHMHEGPGPNVIGAGKLSLAALGPPRR